MKLPRQWMNDPDFQRGLALRRSAIVLGLGVLAVVIALTALRSNDLKAADSGAGVDSAATTSEEAPAATPAAETRFDPQGVEEPARPPRYPGETAG